MLKLYNYLHNCFKDYGTMSTQDLSPAPLPTTMLTPDPVQDLIANLATQPQPGVVVVSSSGQPAGPLPPFIVGTVASPAAPDPVVTLFTGVSQTPAPRTIEAIKYDIDLVMSDIETGRSRLAELQNEFGDACADYHDLIAKHR